MGLCNVGVIWCLNQIMLEHFSRRNEILKREDSNKSYWTVPSSDTGIMQFKVRAVALALVDEILYRDHKSCWEVFSPVVSFVTLAGSNFWVYGWSLKVEPFKWKLLSSTVLCSFYLYAVPCDSYSWYCGLSWNPILWCPFSIISRVKPS